MSVFLDVRLSHLAQSYCAISHSYSWLGKPAQHDFYEGLKLKTYLMSEIVV